MRLNLARTMPRSAANGPGDRFVVWTQGCPLACSGCWNPDTWSFAKRNVWGVDDLVAQIRRTDNIEGVTFTGGEPFVQARALAKVAHDVRSAGLSVFVFSGYSLDELVTAEHQTLLEHIDVLVAGRYIKRQRELLPWRSSRNQKVHFLTERYGDADMQSAPDIEVRINDHGTLVLTGFPPEELLNE